MTTTPTISFSGLASGLNTTSIISNLVAAEQKPITQIQTQEAAYNSALADWQALNTSLSALQTAATALTGAGVFTAASASSSNPSVASITTQPGAQIGSHTLTVSQIAQAQRVVSKSVSSGSTALSETGAFTLNGKTITVNATDALTDLAAKINASGAGVQASVVHVGPNDFRLTLAGTQTGAANSLSASDNGAGTVLADLGLTSSAAAIRDAVAPDAAHSGAGSLGLNSATQSVANALGAAAGSAAAGTVQINGVGVAVDLNADSLGAIAAKINSAGITGITAQVVALPDANGNISGSSPQQLEILSSSATTTTTGGVTTTTVAPPTFTDSNNILGTLGITQPGFTSTISQAQDAKFSLDGLTLTRSSNTVGDAIPGATLTLLSGTAASPGATNLSITQNTAAIVQSVQSFAAAYNAVQDFVTQENTFTPPAAGSAGTAGTSPALFGDSTLSQIRQQLSRTLNAVSGTTSLQSIGLSVNSSGDLTVDTNTLTSALQTDPAKVSGLFGLSARTSDTNVQFVGGSIKTQATGGAGYPVAITQAASQSSALAQAAQSGTSAAAETLTFAGALFNGGTASITLPAGNSLQDTVNQINANSTLSAQLYASIDPATHALKLASLAYGSGTDFTVATSATGGGSGLAAGVTVAAGVDVAGTINGEPATGTGRTLKGNAGNSTTEGLQLLITGITAGAYGSVRVTHGVADALNNAVTQITDPTSGGVILAENSLNSQIASAQTQIAQVKTQVSAYQAYLTQEFADMERRVAALQSQGTIFAAEAGLTSSSSSGKSLSSVG